MSALRPKTLAVFAAIAAAACGREAPRAAVPADVTGTYVFVGADTTVTVPWAARVELSLEGDSTFQFDFRLRIKDEDKREVKSGTYRVEGDRLLLTGTQRDQGPFEFRIRGDSIVMEADLITMAALRLVGVPQPVLVKSR